MPVPWVCFSPWLMVSSFWSEDIIPARADSLLFTLGPVLVVVPVIIFWLIIPFGQNLLISNVGVGIFLWIAFGIPADRPDDERLCLQQQVLAAGLVCGPRHSRSATKFRWLLAVLAIVMMTNSLSTVDIVSQQTGAGILSWNIWRRRWVS